MIRPNQRGMMLIELMIGMFIGLLTTLAIVQVLSVAESQRRSTTTGGDAQISGSVTLHILQRELRQAGYGLQDNPAALGCALKGLYNSISLDLPLAPVVITDGAGGAPDTLSVFSSSRSGASVPLDITGGHPATYTYFDVKGSFAVASNDYLVVVPGSWDATRWCTLIKATSTTPTTVVHESVSAYMPAGGYDADSYLINMGGGLRHRTFAINSQNVLQMTELSGAARDIAPEIVNLQAYYGKDTNSDKIVDVYDTVKPTTAAGWRQVLAIRVALVARSMEYEKDEVTTTEPEWDIGTHIAIAGTVDCVSGSGGQCLQIKVSHLPNWKHYRYKVYDTLIPLRNALWNS